MKKTFFILSLITASVLNFSCSNSDDNTPEETTGANALIGDWKISKYLFINNLNGQQIGSANPDCSGKNLYQLKANNFLNIRMYKSTQYGACLDTPTNDDGQWTYNSGSKMITFYGDADYKVKSISSTQLEIESFDEGYVDYFDKDFNNDGVVDKVVTVLTK
jgi:hypothetical protein